MDVEYVRSIPWLDIPEVSRTEISKNLNHYIDQYQIRIRFHVYKSMNIVYFYNREKYAEFVLKWL